MWKGSISFCGFWFLLLIHFVYEYFSYIANHLLLITTIPKTLCLRVFDKTYGGMYYLQEQVKSFPKLPKHMAIVIDEEEISYNDCSTLILWCTHLGIPFITFYSYSNGKQTLIIVSM